MPCDEPRHAYRSQLFGPTGKRLITFNRSEALSTLPEHRLLLPCQQCMGCRLEHSRQWAVRCMHEYQCPPKEFGQPHYDEYCFLTLTYNNENLPKGATLVREHPQLFLKRLRDHIYPKKFRFYGCGEYGEKEHRPHYHLILFGYDFPDKVKYKVTRGGNQLWTSDLCEKLWPMGFNVLGSVTFESCQYVAKYVTKKVTGEKADAHYVTVCSDGEVIQRLPEFPMRSLKPGIGAGWFEKYGEHAYKWDSVIINGKEARTTRFYDSRYEVLDKDAFAILKAKRRASARSHKEDQTSARRHVKEDVLRLTMQIKQREL